MPGIDGGVLDERDRLRVADHPHQERDAGLADLPEIVLGRLRQTRPDAQNPRASFEFPGEVLGPLGQFLGRVGVELRGEDGSGPACGEAQAPGVIRVARGEVEHHPVDHLDRRRPRRDDLRQAVEGRRNRREGEDHQPLSRRDRHDLDLGPGDHGQGPFRADDQTGQVERPGVVGPNRALSPEVPERTRRGCSRSPVARSWGNGRKSRRDAGRSCRGRSHASVPTGLYANRSRPVRRHPAVRPSLSGSVVEDQVERSDMVDRLAILERPGSGRVIADHPADRRAIAGRDVRPEHQAQGPEVGVEPVEDDPRARPSPSSGRDRRSPPGSGVSTGRGSGLRRSSARKGWSPPLRGTTGTPSSAAIRTQAARSSTVLGRTTPTGSI